MGMTIQTKEATWNKRSVYQRNGVNKRKNILKLHVMDFQITANEIGVFNIVWLYNANKRLVD